jgi:hypothetical protein
MKILIALSLSLLALPALAQRIETTINDVEYSCTPRPHTNPGGNPNGVIACAEKAYAGPFSRDESTRLCQGARSVAPADCALEAYAGPFSKVESIEMCIRAVSTAPIDCFNKAYSGPFSKANSIGLCKGAHSTGPAECAVKAYAGPFAMEEAIRLCSSPRSGLATAECAIRAYSGPYSREQSITMCMNSTLLSKTMVNKDAFEALMIKANKKAVLEGSYKK